jgi:hypothetical protein
MAKKKKQESRFIHIGDIAVDTGRIVVADPCRVDEVMEAIGGAFDPTCYREGKLELGTGVVLPTGVGDGIYPVFAEYDDTFPSKFGERIARITIEFENPFRNAGCQKAFPHAVSDVCFMGEGAPEFSPKNSQPLCKAHHYSSKPGFEVRAEESVNAK